MKNKKFRVKRNLLNTVLRRFTNSNRHYTVRAYRYIPSVNGQSNIYRRNFKSRGYYNKVIKYEVCCPDFPCLINPDGSIFHYYSQFGDQQIASISKPLSLEISFSADSQSERFIPAYWNRIYNINSLQEIYDQYSNHNDYLRIPEIDPPDELRWNCIKHTEWNTDLYSEIGYMLWVEDSSEYVYVFPFNYSNRIDDSDTSVTESSSTLKDGIYIFNYNNKMYAASIGNWDNLIPTTEGDPIIISLDSPDYRVVSLSELLGFSSPSKEILFHRAQGFLYYPVKLPSPMLTFLVPVVLTYKSRNFYYSFVVDDSSDADKYLSDDFYGRMIEPYRIWWAGQTLCLYNYGDVKYSLMNTPYPLTPIMQQHIFDDSEEPTLSLKNYQPYQGNPLSQVEFEDAHIGYVSWKDVAYRFSDTSFASSNKVLYCMRKNLISISNDYDQESDTTDLVRVMYVYCSTLGHTEYVKFKITPSYVTGIFRGSVTLAYSHQPYVEECDVIYEGSSDSRINENFIYAHVLAYNSVFLGKQFIG